MQKIPAKPLIFHRLHISSISVYRKFFKNKYNLAHSLELDVFSSSFGNQTRVKQTKRKLLKMARKTKYIAGLRLHKCLFYNLALKDIQILRLIKGFPHLKHMSLSFEGASIDVLRTYTKWVASLKHLNSLAFIFRRYLTQATFADPMIEQTKKFVQMLRKKRLEKLRVLAEANYNALLTPLFEFSNYPASLKKLNFTWNGFGNILSDFSSSNALLTHMKNLTALSIVLPITTDVLQPIIASVPNPHQISALNLQICHKILNNNTVDFYVLRDTFEGFNGLTRISFKLKTWPGQDQSYWKFLTACPLIEWCLDTPVEEADDLVFVSQIAGSLSNLKSLKLKFKAYKPVDFLQKNCFGIFFQHIAKLKNLEQLKIYFIVFYPPKDKTKSVNFVSSLSKCIDQLSKLSQLSIRFRQGDMTQEFGGLFQSLRNKALNFTKLRINFAGQKIQKTDLDILIEAIHQMKFLQVVVLDELHLAFAEYFKGLADALVSVKYPRIIKLTGISGELDITMFANFVREILPKLGFKQLLCTENGLSKINLVEEANRIKLKGIVEKNSELQSVYVPFNIYYNNSEISFWKWS